MTQTGSQRSTATGDHWTRACRAAAAEGRPLHVSVHTRSVAPEFGTREYHDAVLDRLRQLEDCGCVTDVSFDAWGKQVGTRQTRHVDESTASTVETYRAWADRQDVTLPFEERHCNSTLIDDSYTVLVPPHLLVCVKDGDGEVLGVAPTMDDEGPTSVMDLLTHLEEQSRPEDPRASASA